MENCHSLRNVWFFFVVVGDFMFCGRHGAFELSVGVSCSCLFSLLLFYTFFCSLF